MSIIKCYFTANATLYSTACAWVLANNETWKNWFWECESDCFGQGKSFYFVNNFWLFWVKRGGLFFKIE